MVVLVMVSLSRISWTLTRIYNENAELAALLSSQINKSKSK